MFIKLMKTVWLIEVVESNFGIKMHRSSPSFFDSIRPQSPPNQVLYSAIQKAIKKMKEKLAKITWGQLVNLSGSPINFYTFLYSLSVNIFHYYVYNKR